MADLLAVLKSLLRDVTLFAENASGIRLRDYQKEVAQAIVASVREQLGLTFVVMFPRQSGKNELQAQIEAYLLTVLSPLEVEMVKASPTWKPQTLNAMRRLERVLSRNVITRRRWKKESGYIYRLGKARIFFLSGEPTSNVVGATANTLLECDEAQDVTIAKWDKDFAPMAASTNATRVFWGTAWTGQTLLARELQAARQAEQRDGRKRVFVIDAGRVAQEAPAYGRFVAEQVARLGRNHPLVKTQYFCEEIDAEGGMFTEERLALMRGAHPRREQPAPGALYAVTIDVAGEDEAVDASGEGELRNPARDSTALTVFEVDPSTLADELIRAPTYRVACRLTWTGVKHTQLYAAIRAAIETFRARFVVIDATGVGAGLASFLEKAFGNAAKPGGKVIPFVFTARSKSELGWDFLAIIETGRYKEPAASGSPGGALDDPYELFWVQARHCQARVVEGPGKVLRWGVPEGRRDPQTGELVHDDLLVSAALCAALEKQDWSVRAAPWIVKRRDPLEEIDSAGY